MSHFEVRSLKIVLQLLIFNTICISIYLYQSFLKETFKPNYADDFYAYFIFVFFLGVHAFFGLLTYCLAKLRFPFVYRKRMAYLSIFLPYVVIFLNLDVITTYEYSYLATFILAYAFYRDIKKDLIGKNFTMYINVLANPSGYEHEMVFPDAFKDHEWNEPFYTDDDPFSIDEN